MGGLIAAQWADWVCLTDYQDLVVELMELNIKKCNPREELCYMVSAKMDWCKISEPGYYQNIAVVDKDGNQAGKFVDEKYDVLIGTDIVYWP